MAYFGSDSRAKTDNARETEEEAFLRGSLKPEDLPEATEWTEIGDTVSFLYGGEITDLLRVLAKAEIRDLSIGEPDLEETVLKYYGKDGEQA